MTEYIIQDDTILFASYFNKPLNKEFLEKISIKIEKISINNNYHFNKNVRVLNKGR